MEANRYIAPESYESLSRLVLRSSLHICFEALNDNLLHAAMHFQFDKVYLNALIAPGNFGGSDRSVFQLLYYLPFRLQLEIIHTLGRQGLHETLRNFDAITCFIDKTDDTSLLYSKIELEYLLSDDAAILQPIVILVRTPDASGTVNDPKLITEFELDDVIRESNGRVSIFAYSLSPTRFVGCKEGKL